MNLEQIHDWLRETDPHRLEELWTLADRVRSQNVGPEVHLRGLVEFSNHCARHCAYCGLRVDNHQFARYRLTPEQIFRCADQTVEYSYGTIVLQSGEDPTMSSQWLAQIVKRIKDTTPLAVTLSVGERDPQDYALWRQAGADRYLLRFETSNTELYRKIHPAQPGRHGDRLAILRTLRELGYEIGSGVMVGIPGQSCDDLANDILLFQDLALDMIGLGPYIPHPHTPLAQQASASTRQDQAPNDELTTYKMIALARLACPGANIPSTTALATLNRQSGRELGLQRGANVVMPNLTPVQYRSLYEIYPAKACITETAPQCYACLRKRIESIGRCVGAGRGDSASYRRRYPAKEVQPCVP